jgi:hypothetical protein
MRYNFLSLFILCFSRKSWVFSFRRMLQKFFFKSKARGLLPPPLRIKSETIRAILFAYIKIKQNSTGGETMANQQMSAGAMIGLAIILGALIWLLPGLVIWFAWLAVIFLFIGGLLALFTR